MVAKNRSRIWWWIIPALVILVGLGYYWYTKTRMEKAAIPVGQEISPDRKPKIAKGDQEVRTRVEDRSTPGVDTPDGAPETETSDAQTYPIGKPDGGGVPEMAAQGPIEELFIKRGAASATEKIPSEHAAYCRLIDQHVSDFFQILNTKSFFQQFNLEKDARAYFADVIKRLSARPPEPAGEGIQPKMLLSNIYFFSRALERKDLRVIKAIIDHEGDALEYDLETFYRWLMLGKNCPDPGDIRPSFDVSYRYAGFFLNTIGGRSYLFRRPLRSRILVSYYCVLIIYQADRLGRNSYGIDVVPYLNPLKEEIAHHPELEFQDQYISTLNRIEQYYLLKR
jgi:hypothetical protein